MYKVGICGHFAFGDEQFNSGQKDKTQSVYSALVKVLGKNNVVALDTRGWQKNPLRLILQCKKLLAECENIIMLPATNGLKIFPFLFETLNSFYKRKLHYAVVGGWLADFLKSNTNLIKSLKKLDGIFVEVPSMQRELNIMGFTNVHVMPNFHEVMILSTDELCFQSEPYKLCTFSRIRSEKGIEDAVEAVRNANAALGRTAYTLDIYGLPDEDYKERFEELKSTFEPFITYKGFLSGTESISRELCSYFAMLFPTRYEGEGFAGTIVDAFSAGVPVIATDWKYNKEVVTHGIDGILYNVEDRGQLSIILIEAADNPDTINSMRKACLIRAREFSPENGIKIIVDKLR
ncbi:MAG: glycosyltransferase [Clostridia bacterium]|nr:glycosyltransferase [Clostridia bacterium]